MLEELHERLAGVSIEKLPYEGFISRYDREGTLFYLDPPYFGVEDYYGRELFSRDEFAKMAEQLKHIKGKFILSLNATPEVREIFKAFAIEEVSVNYTASRKVTKLARELIISNCGKYFRHVSAKEVSNG